MSTNTQSLSPTGIAARAKEFPKLAFLANSFNGTNDGVTAASVAGLVLKGIKVLSPALPSTTVHLLSLLVEHVYDSDRWLTGKLTVMPGNRRLARMMSCDERHIRRLLRLLEDNHWIVRVYSNTNRRSGDAGIDLRPLAARLAELHEAVIFLEDQIKAEREENIEVRNDALERREESSQGDSDVPLESYNLNPGSMNLVQRPGSVSGVSNSDDQALIVAMVKGSPSLQANMTPAELMDALSDNPSPSAVQAVARSVNWMMTNQVRLRAVVWKDALQTHGWAAMAAVCVAVDRHGVKNPAGYLHSMFKASHLRRTIRLNLRALIEQEAGHA